MRNTSTNFLQLTCTTGGKTREVGNSQGEQTPTPAVMLEMDVLERISASSPERTDSGGNPKQIECRTPCVLALASACLRFR